jgi:drug/metabolite transporter, DME family
LNPDRGATTPGYASPVQGLLRYRLALVAAAVLWSLGGVMIKSLPVSAVGITFYRSLFAALCLLPLLFGRKLPSLRDSLIAVLLYAGLLALYVAATQGTTAANAIFLQYTAPACALLLGPVLFRDPFTRQDVWAVVAAMVGMAILFLGSFQGGERLPLLMGLGSGFMFGIFLLWLRHMRSSDPFAVTAVNNGGVAAIAAVTLLFVNPQELLLVPKAFAGGPSMQTALLLVLMGCIQIAAPYVLFSYGLQRVPAVEASLLALVEPLLNPVWVMIGVGERPTHSTIIGGAIIVAALAARYTLFRPKVEGKTRSTNESEEVAE